MKKKCGLFFVSVIFFCTFFFLFPVITHADSGWDSDYGGGGSDWGGSSSYDSDWGGSSSYDHDWGSSRSSSRRRYNDPADYLVLGLIVLIVLLPSIATLIQIAKRREEREGVVTNYGDEDDLVRKFFPDMDEKQLLDRLVEQFITIQNAWMNFDYSTLEKTCTKELYESYKDDLEMLKAKNQKNNMNDFSLCAVDLKDIKEENGLIIVSVYLHMKFIDYVVDMSTDTVVRGSRDNIIHNQYNLDYVITKENGGVCPNCGAELKDEKECPYCHTPIPKAYHDFVLSKKSRIT